MAENKQDQTPLAPAKSTQPATEADKQPQQGERKPNSLGPNELPPEGTVPTSDPNAGPNAPNAAVNNASLQHGVGMQSAQTSIRTVAPKPSLVPEPPTRVKAGQKLSDEQIDSLSAPELRAIAGQRGYEKVPTTTNSRTMRGWFRDAQGKDEGLKSAEELTKDEDKKAEELRKLREGELTDEQKKHFDKADQGDFRSARERQAVGEK